MKRPSVSFQPERFGIIRLHPADDRLHGLRAARHRGHALHFGRHEGDIGHAQRIAQRLDILHRQRRADGDVALQHLRGRPGRRLFRRAGHHVQQIGTETAKRIADVLLDAAPDRHQRNHRRHADDDAQHGQRRAQLIGRQRPQRHADIFENGRKVEHEINSSNAGSGRKAEG